MRVVCLSLLAAWQLAAQSQSYFPLDVGNRWVYRDDSRLVTAEYETWRVDRLATANGYTYSVFAIEGPSGFYGEQWFRADASGRVYLLGYNGDVLFLDPTILAPNSGQVQLTGAGGTVKTALGTFSDTMNYTNNLGGSMERETGTLARGVGLLASNVEMLTGSSGGTVETRTLVEAQLAGGVRLPALQASVSLGIESLTLDVSGKQVTNCAVPCYFAACYMAPGADPPGTYKPCARARVELNNWPSGASRQVALTLTAPDGSTAFSQSLALDAATGASVGFLQLPLYSAPNQPLAPGAYQLSAKSSDGSAQAALAVQIQ